MLTVNNAYTMEYKKDSKPSLLFRESIHGYHGVMCNLYAHNQQFPVEHRQTNGRD